MRRAAWAVAGVVAISLMLSGCGTSVPGVPNTVAKVNGTSISASTYLDQLSRRSGQDMLRSLIEQQIILQWAADEKLSPTPAQVEEQKDLLKSEGVYDDQLKSLGEENLNSEIQAMQARINLAKKIIKTPPAQLKQIYEITKGRWVHGPRKQIAVILNSDSSKLDEALKKIKDGADYDEVAMEFGIGSRGPIKVWADESQAIPPPILKAAKETKVGEVSKVIPFGGQFAIVKVLQEQPKQNKTFDQVKGQIENLAAMQASGALQPTVIDPRFAEKLNERLKEAKVEVEIPEFKSLTFHFKNPPEAPMMPSAPPPGARPAPPAKTK